MKPTNFRNNLITIAANTFGGWGARQIEPLPCLSVEGIRKKGLSCSPDTDIN